MRLVNLVHCPANPMNRIPFDILLNFAKLGTDLARLRRRMEVVRSIGHLKCIQRKLFAKRQQPLCRMSGRDRHATADHSELFPVPRPTANRILPSGGK